jgi:muramoyltetrapeptide carboxypeptidase
MKHARPLKEGDTIGIAASSSPFDRNEFKRGVHVLEKLGFNIHHRKDIFDQNRYLAGTDARRAEELTELFCNSKVDAIMFSRGGYGSQRVIPLLDKNAIASHPKPVVGFSDLTALLIFLNQDCEIPTFYGPVITMLGKHKEELTAEKLKLALTTAEPLGDIPSVNARTFRPGNASGKLAGGCLSIICSSMGTSYQLNAENSILFIEEVGEKVYVLDRMLTQLKNAGILDKARGIIVGSVVQLEGEPNNLDSMLADVLNDFTGPVITDYPTGHTHPFVTLPLGTKVEINASEGVSPTVTAIEGSFS